LRIVTHGFKLSFIPLNAHPTNWQGIIDIIISISGSRAFASETSSILSGSFIHSKKYGCIRVFEILSYISEFISLAYIVVSGLFSPRCFATAKPKAQSQRIRIFLCIIVSE
jgi:hypothetical protein